MKISFIKEGGLFYADLPFYKGEKSDTLMVGGTSKFLHKLGKTSFNVFTEEPENHSFLFEKTEEVNGWAYYKCDDFNYKIPLCPVLKWFFGNVHPEKIWIVL